MKLLKRKVYSQSGLQDAVFLFGIVILLSILVIGLLPAKQTGNVVVQDMFIYVIMVIPAITAIYFIVISFRKNIYIDPSRISNSIQKKITVALLFVAILPSIPIVLASNYLINQNLSSMVFDNISISLNEAASMSVEPISDLYNNLESDIQSLRYLINNSGITPQTATGRHKIKNLNAMKNITTLFYKKESTAGREKLKRLDSTTVSNIDQLEMFYHLKHNYSEKLIDRLSIGNKHYLSGAFPYREYLVICFVEIPKIVDSRVNLFANSLHDYKRLQYLGVYFRNNTSVFLLILSLFLIIISVFISIYLSKGLTRPVLELAEAANEVALGNFRVSLTRSSDDELGFLFKSFNQMVVDLNENRKIMYQKQRLEAWREMARRLVHEIKNPLTPIRLSAERMRKRFLEQHPEIEKIILSGTETIIEEVIVLMNILSEFTKFARLPELNRIYEDLNPMLENCISFFSGNEQVTFTLNLDEQTPKILIDKVLIRQAMTNLLQNAIDAIGAGGHIELSSSFFGNREPRFVRIFLKDDGIGIKENEIEHIFEPGFSKKASGTGLGLAIVEKIIIEHNGKIRCNSEYGKGTEFIIDLFVDR